MENIKLNNIIIRQETKEDYYNTELMTMRAFWNLHGPGCNEHFLVHILREAKEYLPELSRVAELDGRIVGAIFYSKSKVVDGNTEHEKTCCFHHLLLCDDDSYRLGHSLCRVK